MDEIIARLLRDTNALGVWLLGPVVVTSVSTAPTGKPNLKVVVESESYLVADDQRQAEVLATAVKEPSVTPPLQVVVESEAYLDFGDRQVFARPIATAVLVIVFDRQSSLGLIRLRVRHVHNALAAALAARP